MSIKSTLSEKRIAIVCNPLAGIGKAVILADKLAQALAKRAVDHRLFKKDWPIAWDGFTDIFIVGGDGTLNYFINQYPDVELPLAVFNGGTGNDFHWMLYGNTTMEKQLDRVLEADAKPVDCGRCNDRLFLNGLGIGFEGEVAASLMGKKKRFGKKSFMLAVLKKIILYRSKFYKISCAEKTIEGRHMMMSIMNGKRAGGDFHISPESSPVDGLFNVVLVDSLNVFKRFRYLPVIEKGKHLKLSFIDHFNTAQLTIECEEPIIAHLDGEFYSADRMEVSLLAGKFRFKY
jgi:diacylglycerol kinase (ATP)